MVELAFLFFLATVIFIAICGLYEALRRAWKGTRLWLRDRHTRQPEAQQQSF